MMMMIIIIMMMMMISIAQGAQREKGERQAQEDFFGQEQR